MRRPVVAILELVPLLIACAAGSSVEPPNQGALQQTPAGQIVANLSNRGISKDPRFNDTSMIALYLYKKVDYSLSCASAPDRLRCEDGLIFKNEKVDSLGFTNEPGYFGYDADYGSYYPMLIADPGQSYPTTKPADPPGFPDPDVWQCIRNPYTTSPNYNKYECGVNFHPIRYFRRDLTTYTLQVYAADGRGYASSYILDYNLFNSLNHPVRDGDRFFAYFAVHFNAMKQATDSEDRFDGTASTWKRPIEPDLVSPRIEIKLKLLAEGPYDKPGSVYDIPDYSTWYDPLANCRTTQSVPVNSIYISELMWMGSEDTTGNADTTDEFIELYNSNSFAVVLSNWKIEGAGSGSNAIVLPMCAVIPAGGVYTIGRQTGKAFSQFDFVTSQLSLSNSGENLTVKNADGATIYALTGCTSPAWGGNGVNGSGGVPKRSMRLSAVTTPSSSCGSGWATSSVLETNYATNSAGVRAAYRYADTLPDNTSGDGTLATPGYAGP